jgi:hypothetical protein
MATLTLTKEFINLVSSGQSVSGQSARERPQAHSMEGDVQEYASGRLRGQGQEGIRAAFDRTLRDMSLEDLETLKTWLGETVLVRDYRGQHFYCTFYSVEVVEMREPELYDLKCAFRTVTHAEGV